MSRQEFIMSHVSRTAALNAANKAVYNLRACPRLAAFRKQLGDCVAFLQILFAFRDSRFCMPHIGTDHPPQPLASTRTCSASPDSPSAPSGMINREQVPCILVYGCV